MGAFYDIRCPVCEPRTEKPAPDYPDPFEMQFYRPSGIMLGCGLSYPEVCESVYHDIRQSKLGKDAQKAMRWMFRPAVYVSRELFVCKDCGRWQSRDDIRLCRLKPGRIENRGSSIDQARQRRVKANVKALCYLDEKEYDVVWEAKYPCAHCGGETAVRDVKELRCHRCGGPMDARCTGHWD